MKYSILIFITSTCFVGVSLSKEREKPVYRDAQTHDQISKRLEVSSNNDRMKKLIPSEREDPSVKNRPQDIISSSDVISFSGVTTLVPKQAIMKIPEIYANRINNHVPGNRIVGWFEFYRMNRGWITPVEVTVSEAEGKIAMAEEVTENLEKRNNLIIATYSASPISLLKSKEEPKVTTENKKP